MNKPRYCSFYVSDIHLVTMLLPYINEKMKEKKEFITIFETDISESAKKVIKSISLKRKEEEKFLRIGWCQNNDYKKINLKDKYVIVMGSDNFIEKINKELNTKEENFIIINCFEIFQAEKNINEIIDAHEIMINSKGEINVKEKFTQCTKKNNKKITIIE